MFIYIRNNKSIFLFKNWCNFRTQIFKDFARIFEISKLLEVNLHPELIHYCLTSQSRNTLKPKAITIRSQHSTLRSRRRGSMTCR